MSKRNLLIVVCLFLVFTACIQAPDFYTYDYPEFAKDVGPPNKNVSDNKVFKGGREFEYSYQFLDSVGVEQKIVTFYNFSTKDPLDWRFTPAPADDPLSSEYPIDGVRLKVLKNTANATQADQQTIVVYEFFNEGGTIIPETERTGVTEDSSTIFLFPPRNSGFSLTELAPFPQVVFPLDTGKIWEDNLTVSVDWSEATKIPFERILYLYSTYTVEGKTKLNTPIGEREVWVINAVAEFRLGNTSSILHFDEELGFVKMVFTFLNGSQLMLNLEKVTS